KSRMSPFSSSHPSLRSLTLAALRARGPLGAGGREDRRVDHPRVAGLLVADVLGQLIQLLTGRCGVLAVDARLAEQLGGQIDAAGNGLSRQVTERIGSQSFGHSLF